MPCIENYFAPTYEKVKQHHDEYNKKAKRYANSKSVESDEKFNIGDMVYLKRGKKDNKYQSHYFNDEFTILNVKHKMVIVKNNNTGRQYARHVSFLKHVVKMKENDNYHDTLRKNRNNDITNENRKQYPLRSRSGTKV